MMRELVPLATNISMMARYVADGHEEIQNICRQFFIDFAPRGTLYSQIPEIFTQLCNPKNLSDRDLKNIMRQAESN